MRRPGDESGFVLVTAIVLLTVIMGLGIGLLLLTDNQQQAAAREQASESAFNVAEAALNAQIDQVSRSWPATKPKEAQPYETTGCTPTTSTATNGCPTPESMKVAYPQLGTTSCPAGVKDAWGSPSSNEWTTYVRDDAPSSSLFNSEQEDLAQGFDANKDNKLWVRAVGVVQCRLVALTSLVSRQEIAANFPHVVMSGNWFTTGNNGKGKEVIVEGESTESGELGEVDMRCTGISNVEECEHYREGQLHAKVNPPPGAPTPTLTAAQLEGFKQAAEAEGTYYGPGKCPSGLPAGKPVYVEGPCNVEGGKKEVGNSKENPGFLIIVNGTFSLGGNAEFWGTVYCANHQESSGIVVSVGGTAQLVGEIIVDGNGGMEVGESHKENVKYDPRSATELKAYVGATPTRNSFRVLSANE
jgi:type II secretory pathway pseudopilin PulG